MLDRRTAKVLMTILVFALGLAIVYVARTVFIVFIFAILFSYLIDPVVRFLQRHSSIFQEFARDAYFGGLSRTSDSHCSRCSWLGPGFLPARGRRDSRLASTFRADFDGRDRDEDWRQVWVDGCAEVAAEVISDSTP